MNLATVTPLFRRCSVMETKMHWLRKSLAIFCLAPLLFTSPGCTGHGGGGGALFALALLGGGNGSAGGTIPIVSGFLKDSSGLAIPGVSLSFKAIDSITGVPAVEPTVLSSTNSSGFFTASGLSAGSYSVSATKSNNNVAAFTLVLNADGTWFGSGMGLYFEPTNPVTTGIATPCITRNQFSLVPKSTAYLCYGPSASSQYCYATAYQNFLLGISNTVGIIYAQQDHSYSDRPLLFYDWKGSVTTFINQEPITAATYGTSMNPYGIDGYHYAGTPTYYDEDHTFQVRVGVPDPLKNVTGYMITGCRDRLVEDGGFEPDIYGTPAAQRGLGKKWDTSLNLNVHLIFVDGSDENANPAGFQGAMDRVKQIFAQDTVKINVHFSSVTIANPAYLSISSLNDETGTVPGSLTNMYTSTGAFQRADALNIFITKEETLVGGVLGMSSGIPGLPGVLSSKMAGMTVFVEAHQTVPGDPLSAADLQFIGDTIAHEAGHYLGLFHLNESSGVDESNAQLIRWYRDPLVETPFCDKTNDVNPMDGYVAYNECDGITVSDSGARNLMFWSSAPFEQVQLTGEQGWVLRAHPLVYR